VKLKQFERACDKELLHVSAQSPNHLTHVAGRHRSLGGKLKPKTAKTLSQRKRSKGAKEHCRCRKYPSDPIPICTQPQLVDFELPEKKMTKE